MTVREFYDNTLIELNKVEAPSLLLEDFNYFANKAVQQYTNKVYNRYDTNQQSTDDLSALKMTSKLTINSDNPNNVNITMPKESANYYCKLPENYLHLLNCIVEFEGGAGNGCVSGPQMKQSMARRLTSDMYPSVIRNAYFKPSYKCPYYFINNSTLELVNDLEMKLAKILDPTANDSDFYDNLRMEIRCGDTSK